MTYKSNNAAAIKEAKAFIGTMWSSGKTSVKSTGALTEQPVNGQEYVDQVLRLIKEAKSSIKFAMYEVAYDPNNPSAAHSKLLWELKNAYQRGVDVQILLDDPRYYDAQSGGKFLTKYKVPHKLDLQTVGLLEKKHLKAFLIDDSTLVIGSHNWNKDSAASSNEYSIIIRGNDKVNDEFKIQFEGLWNDATWKVPPPE
jgi:phosphatidylserine/phosphatidylglycerophosphate/cardiolipin synthase-like enzyme